MRNTKLKPIFINAVLHQRNQALDSLIKYIPDDCHTVDGPSHFSLTLLKDRASEALTINTRTKHIIAILERRLLYIVLLSHKTPKNRKVVTDNKNSLHYILRTMRYNSMYIYLGKKPCKVKTEANFSGLEHGLCSE